MDNINTSTQVLWESKTHTYTQFKEYRDLDYNAFVHKNNGEISKNKINNEVYITVKICLTWNKQKKRITSSFR